MKIVVLEGYAANPGDLSWTPLEQLGELTVYDRCARRMWPRALRTPISSSPIKPPSPGN